MARAHGPTPSPDRLAAVRAFALQRSAEIRARDRIATILRTELPELAPDRAADIADRIMDDAEDRLASGFASSPDVAAAAVIALVFGGLR